MKTKVTVIAEAGVNHNGDLNVAKKMVDAAKAAGADYVKFQTFMANQLVTKSATQAEYQKVNTGKTQSQYEMLKALELSAADHQELKDYCIQADIGFLSTAFDFESVLLLNSLGMDFWKIPSGEITNLPYLEMIASFRKPIVISTGMADMHEIEASLEVFKKNGYSLSDITVLHCTTDYPASMDDVNLRAMSSIQDRFGTKIGYSDHTLGIEIPIAAVAMGATLIEKHFTLDRKMDGPDHKASLEPSELKQMIMAIRNIELALGNGIKSPTEKEKQNKSVARKSIVASKPVKKGEVFTTENLTTKRPGTGISPMRWHEILGSKAGKDYQADDLI